MKRDQKQRLAQSLLAESPYYQLVFRDEPEKLRTASMAQRVEIACADPAFFLHVAQSFAHAGLPLPQIGWPVAVVRAYAFFLDPSRLDPDMALVLRLNDPENRTQRDAIRALLICPDNTLQQVADLLGLSLDALSLFEILTWDCRDRLNDRTYLAQICRIPGFARNVVWPHDTGCQLLQVAYYTQRAASVLAETEFATTLLAEESIEELQSQILNTVLTSTLERLWARKVAKDDNPFLDAILSIVAARQREKTLREAAIVPPSPAEAIDLTFRSPGTETQTPPNTAQDASASPQ